MTRATVDIKMPALRKVQSTITVPDDLLLMGGSNTNTLIGNQLRHAIGLAVDKDFLDQIVTTATTSNSSTGLTAAAVLDDLDVALQSLSIGADARLYFVVPSAVCAKLALAHTADGLGLFPQLSPTGGVIANIRTVVSNAAVSDGYLLDASQIAFASDLLRIDASIQTAVEMSDDPTVGAPVTLRSMFQANETALKATRYYSCSPLRDTAVAVISGMVTA